MACQAALGSHSQVPQNSIILSSPAAPACGVEPVSLCPFLPSPSRAPLPTHTLCFPVSLYSRVVPSTHPRSWALSGVGLFLHRHVLCSSSASCCCNVLLLPVHVASCSRLLGVWHRHVSSHLLLSSSLGAKGGGLHCPYSAEDSSVHPFTSPPTCLHIPLPST